MYKVNFLPMKYGMPLVSSRKSSEIARDWEWFYEEPMTDREFRSEGRLAFQDAEALAAEFSKTLLFHTVSVFGGELGFQFYVDEVYSNRFVLNSNSRHCVSNRESYTYFGMCRLEALRRADAEKKRIRMWLMGLGKYGYSVKRRQHILKPQNIARREIVAYVEPCAV